MLQQPGHHVVAYDLAGTRDHLPPSESTGLSGFANHIASRIDEESEPVILVGHSMGGIVASQVAEWRSDRLVAVVYVCGLLLSSGETLTAFLKAHADLGVEDLVLANMQVSPDGEIATFPKAMAPEVFYNCCSPEDAAWAAARLRPQATRVYGDPLALTSDRFDTVRKFYVEALQDRAVSPIYQRLMVSRTPCEKVFTLDTDHSPFLSRPAELRDILTEVAERTA